MGELVGGWGCGPPLKYLLALPIRSPSSERAQGRVSSYGPSVGLATFLHNTDRSLVAPQGQTPKCGPPWASYVSSMQVPGLR